LSWRCTDAAAHLRGRAFLHGMRDESALAQRFRAARAVAQSLVLN
jgi:hypothetical protein